MPSSSSNVELCKRANQEFFGEGRLELADELFSSGFIDHSAPGELPRGPEGPRMTVRWIHTGVSDLRYEIEDAFGAGDRVALRVAMHGTHTGELFGMAATGRSFTLRQMHIFRIEDGKIAEHWALRDELGLMRQLGAAA